MKVGFTGTQLGMTGFQIEELTKLLMATTITQFHHGDCIGADEQAHEIAKALGIPVAIHPPINPSKRAFCKGWKS